MGGRIRVRGGFRDSGFGHFLTRVSLGKLTCVFVLTSPAKTKSSDVSDLSMSAGLSFHEGFATATIRNRQGISLRRLTKYSRPYSVAMCLTRWLYDYNSRNPATSNTYKSLRDSSKPTTPTRNPEGQRPIDSSSHSVESWLQQAGP